MSYIKSNDSRQESIVFQNALAHATAISIHNSGGDKVSVDDVIGMAYRIAEASINPSRYSDEQNALAHESSLQQSADMS